MDTQAIWKEFRGDLYRFILSRVDDRALAEDLLQEAFIRIHEKIGQVKEREKLHSWVFMVTRNIIADHFRKAKTPDRHELMKAQLPDEPENVYKKRLGLDIRKMLRDMPDKECDAFCLYELDGIPQKEVAEKLGISYAAAKTRILRTRQLIRDRLMECCHFEFDRSGRVVEYHPHECCCCYPGSS